MVAALIVQWPTPPDQRLLIQIPPAVLGAAIPCENEGYELVVRWSLTQECALPLPGLPSVTPTADPLIVSVSDPGDLTALPPRLPSPMLTAAERARVVGANFGNEPGRIQLAGVNFPLEVVGPDPQGWRQTTIDAWMPAVGTLQCRSRTEALFREARLAVTRTDSRTASYPPPGLPGPLVHLPPPWIHPIEGVRFEGDRLYIGDEERRERGNRLADHLTFRDARDDFASRIFLLADGASLPIFAPPSLGAISSTSNLDGLVSSLLDAWGSTIGAIPREMVAEAGAERWSDSFATATVPGGDGIPAKARYLFTTRAGVPSNVVDVRSLDIDLNLAPLVTLPPPPRVTILFDQTELGTATDATNAKHPDLTPMVTVLVVIDPSIGAGLDWLSAALARANAAQTQFAALLGLLGGLGGTLAGLLRPNLLLGLATVGSALELDTLEFRAGGLFGMGRISAEDIARSAVVSGPPGSVVHLHNSRGGTNGEGTIVVTIPSTGIVRIPAIYRQNGTALPVSEPAGAVSLLDGKEPPWPWTTFRDHLSSVTFL